MKTVFILALLSVCPGAFAQPISSASTSSATTSAQGNSQAVNFSSPADVTTQSTLNSNQNINNMGATTNTIDYRGSYTIRNVPSVNGPNLTTSNDTCMGSSSASANGPGVGLSFGTTWTDEHCKRLKMSRELWNKGMKAASLAMDCMDPQAMAALEMTGTKCPQTMTAEERVSAYGPQASLVGAAAAPLPLPLPLPLPSPAAAPVATAPIAAAPVAPMPAAAAVAPVEATAEQDPFAGFLARRLGEPVGNVASAPPMSGLPQ
jgi:hypothetical protein